MKRICVLMAATAVVAIVCANPAIAQCDGGYGGCAGGDSIGCGDYGCGGYALDGCCGPRLGKLKCGKFAMKKACRKGRRACGGCYASCGDGYSGCGDYGGCDGGCTGGEHGDYHGEVVGEYPVGESIISEGYSEGIEHSQPVPVESGVPVENPPLPPEEIGPTTWRLPNQNRVQQVSFEPKGAAELSQGLHSFWAGQYDAAIQALTEATAADPNVALAHYMLAISHRRLGEQSAAKAALTTALAAEQVMPVCNWGMQMQRIQGADRIWLEDARYAAGL
ncbi:MAG: tetratricopeptide repeat protein [Planctomycetota bacterium]|nr:tetratricopeptide repeat protein [Planctomycetota bacterium]